MTTPPPMPDTSGIVLPSWAGPIVVGLTALTVIIGVLITVADKLRALLGPLGKSMSNRQHRLDDRALGRLRTRGELDDARVDDLREEVTYLREEIKKLRAERQADWSRHEDDRLEWRKELRELRTELEQQPKGQTNKQTRSQVQDAGPE